MDPVETPVADPAAAPAAEGFQTLIDKDGNLTEGWQKHEGLRDAAGADVIDSEIVGRYTNVADLFKSTFHAKKTIGADNVVVPTEASSEEVWNDYFNKGGRPETPEAYTTKFDDLNIGDKEKTGWLGEFHKLGLSDKQANGLLEHLRTTSKTNMADLEVDAANERKEADEKLRSELRDTYDATMKLKDDVLLRFDKTGVFEQLGLLKEPEVLKILGEIGSSMSEDTLIPSKLQTANTSSIKGKIRELMANPAFTDRNNPQHEGTKEQVTKLYQQLHSENS